MVLRARCRRLGDVLRGVGENEAEAIEICRALAGYPVKSAFGGDADGELVSGTPRIPRLSRPKDMLIWPNILLALLLSESVLRTPLEHGFR
jgi:hypothetical protein